VRDQLYAPATLASEEQPQDPRAGLDAVDKRNLNLMRTSYGTKATSISFRVYFTEMHEIWCYDGREYENDIPLVCDIV
jgi:hypothetical protein